MRKQFSVVFVLVSVLTLTGCGSKTDESGRTEAPNTPPEAGASLATGAVLLNVSGAGYQIGDVVQIRTNVVDLSKGDVVLFDWRKASGDPGGFGPTNMIGEVAGLPGDQLDMSVFLKYVGRDGKEKNAWFGTFEKRGAKNYGSKIILPVDDYLLETEGHLIIVDHASISALVIQRLRHDAKAAKELKQRVY